MDDLYENLENYYDEKIIDELKNENKELKTKLEEYSSAMTRLQKDFDKLNSEYKRLEINYSSLLKTARAEIERKTEMIKSLNTEKDLLIIKTLQTSGTKNSRKFNIHNTQQTNKSHESERDSKSAGKLQPEAQQDCQNEKNHGKERINLTATQSEMQTIGNKPNFSKEIKDDLNNKMSTSKENIGNEILKNHLMKSGKKISSRRKSMIFCSNIEPIFSSDDDLEAINLKNMRKSPLREDTRYYAKYRSRDNFSSKDSSRYYNNKTNRFLDQCKHDRYESSSKYTRHSPEHYCSKLPKEHSEAYKLRANYKNSRKSSPHSDKYNRSKSRDRRTFDGENYFDKHSPHNYNNFSSKHKIRHDLDEPSSKRHKTNQYKDNLLQEKISNEDKGAEYGFSFTKQDFMESTSCQSPDYVNIENTIPQHTVKEIKHTAATPLEDPRVLSKKYILKSNEGKTFLSTLVSEDIDIKPVNISLWSLPKEFMRPSLLTERISEEISRDLVNMDTDKPSFSDSLESGEIQSFNYHGTQCTKDRNRGNDTCEDKNNTDNLKTSAHLVTNKYKIPKLKKPKELDQLSNNQNNPDGKCDISNVTKTPNNNSTTLQITPNTIVGTDYQYKNNEAIKTNNVLPKNSITAIKCTLADDLELSDETSESKDLHSDSKKFKQICPRDNPSVDSLDFKNKQYDMPLVDDTINSKLKEKSKPLSSKKATKDSSRDSSKIRKTKKKTEVKDAICTEIKDPTKMQSLDKLKSKPAISIQTKHKFSDLFGDSSSLITPDDLGIAHSDIQLPLTDVSIFDNTQDAVDLSVEDIKAQSNGTKTNTFLAIQEEQSHNKVGEENTQNDVDKPVNQGDFDKNANNRPKNSLFEKATTDSDSEIVKTIVISSGVQPKLNSDSNLLEDHKCDENKDNINNPKSNVINKIKALATSTPQKIENFIDTSSIPDHILNNGSKVAEDSNLSSNASNPDEIVHDTDVPDVRIFVKRRRKMLKKAS